MVKRALLPVCKTDTTRSGNIRRARLVITTSPCSRAVPGRQEVPENTNKSRWFSGCPGVPGTARERRQGGSMRLACPRFGGRLNRFWRVIPRFPAHYILMQDIRYRCSAHLGLHHSCPYCLTLPARARSMAHRLRLCPRRLKCL